MSLSSSLPCSLLRSFHNYAVFTSMAVFLSISTFNVVFSFTLPHKIRESISVHQWYLGADTLPRYKGTNSKSFFIATLGSVKPGRGFKMPHLNAILERMYNKNNNYDSDLVLDDFDQILNAIDIYKKAYGDLEIPVKFDVPAEDPWPSLLHGLRLGKRLEKILSSPEFFTAFPGKVSQLKSLGFEPSVKSLVDDWALIYKSMCMYKELNGDLRVPSKFVVPDKEPWPRLCRKLKLGIRVAAIRSAGRYVKDRPERKVELDALGFEWRLRDHTHRQQVGEELFDQIYEALVVYKEKEGNIDVPVEFTVPEDDSAWPESVWGLALGQQVLSIRNKDKLVFGHADREEKLSKLGFSWEETGRAVYSKKRFQMVYDALIVYKEQNGDLLVPQLFVVPSAEPYPEGTWGLKLGARVHAIRSQGTLVSNMPERRVLLDDIGFVWELPQETKRRKRRESGLDELSGDLDLAMASVSESELSSFDDDDDLIRSDASDDLSGEPSGSRIDRQPGSIAAIEDDEERAARLLSKQRAISLSLPGRTIGDANFAAAAPITSSSSAKDRGGVLSYDPSRMFEPIAYREIAAEGIRDYIASREYSDDPAIRETAHFEGQLSPEQYHKIITRPIPEEDKAAMRKIGYRILEFGQFNWQSIYSALKVYHSTMGNLDVPHKFVVTEEMIMNSRTSQSGRSSDETFFGDAFKAESDEKEVFGFDESMEGIRLGEAVAGIRSGDIDGREDPERRKLLDELGFDWGDSEKYQRYRFIPMMLGLQVFKHLYGFALPQSTFVIPDEPQWPYWMAGMPLGLWCSLARVQQRMIEEHYPQRRDMLNALEFLWWVPPGKIDEKYFEPVE